MSDHEAFRQLFETNFAYVWGVLRRLGVPAEDAEDRCHEVFLTVHRRLATYDSTRPLRPWLFGVAYRIASHHHRAHAQRREVIGVDPMLTDPRPGPDDELADREQRSTLSRAIEALDLERRAVLIMHDWDGEPMPEVAQALGIPLNTAYSRLRLARVDLLAAVKRVAARTKKRAG